MNFEARLYQSGPSEGSEGTLSTLLSSQIRLLLEAIRPFKELREEASKADILARGGFLAHRSSPLNMIHADISSQEIERICCDYYCSSWDTISKDFTNHLDGYSIPQESKQVFSDCLKAHENGLYRLVPRALIPEVERIALHKIYQNPFLKGKTSVREIREFLSRTPIRDLREHRFWYEAYEQIDKFLFLPVPDQSVVTDLSKSLVPNRHAAIHGIIIYDRVQDSLNTLFLVDFFFFFYSQLQKIIDGESKFKT